MASFGVLVLENVQPEDSATYRCTAANSVGQSLPYDVRLDIVEPLSVQLEPDGAVLRINQGQTASIKCSFHLDQQQQQQQQPHHYVGNNGLAGHSGRPAMKWLKDGLAISTSSASGNNNPKYQQSAVTSPSPVHSGQQYQIWTLRIANVQRADQGIYQCFVYTDKETAQSAVRLVLGGRPGNLIATTFQSKDGNL